jgi:hypothetical protein
MKFSEKYELLESLTTGAVETFVANDRVRGERVLVHIVECAPQKPEQTTAEWVLESFRRLAPEPPGPVLETGKYSGAKYAYVVSKPADENIVKSWIRRYELHVEDTKETKVQALKRESMTPAVAPPLAPITPKEPPQAAPPGQMTQLFRDFDSLAKSKAPEPAMPVSVPVRPAPSTSLLGESGLREAVPWDPSSMKAASPKKEPPFTVPSAPPKPVAPELPPPVARDNAKPGEFTSFFQGPFRGDGPSDMPAYSSQPVEPPKKNVGEFTALFGGATPPKSTPAPPGATGPSFTGLFKDFEDSRPTHNAPAPPQGGVMPPSVQPLPTVQPMNTPSVPDPVFAGSPPVPVAIPNLPTPATPPSPSGPAERPLPQRPSSLSGDGATGAFRHPTAEPEPVPVEAPSGPSPYTQIISRPKLAAAQEGETGQAPAAGAGAGKFAAPSMPKIPAAAPPPMPKAPPMPKVKAPQAPKAPKIDAPAPPPVSLAPLIITLTVLFFLAVILVLYFVLRH